ncbi:MAG: lasso peptide biosynthesis PqqD family chaperone [Heyndrickxia sp.]
MIQKEKLSIYQHQLSQKEGIVVSDMNGEKVMLHIQKGKYFNLGEIGGKIWGYLKNPTTVSVIVSKLMEEYDVSEETCEQQVISFLELLKKEDLILYESVLLP